jgi:hypothetical protein
MSELNHQHKEYRGSWFLPQSTFKIPGILEINEENGTSTLKLFSNKNIDGNDFPRRVNMKPGFLNAKLILGEVDGFKEEKHITLYAGKYSNGTLYEKVINNDFREIIYKPRYVFIGSHFKSDEEIVFTKYAFEVTGTKSWYNGSRFWMSEEDLKIDEYHQTLFSDTEKSITYSHFRSLLSESNTLTSSMSAQIELSFLAPKTLKYCEDLKHKILSFYRFATTNSINSGKTFYSNERAENLYPVHTYFNSINEKNLFSRYHFISFHDHGSEKLKAIFENWVNSSKDLIYPIDLFFQSSLNSLRDRNKELQPIEYTNSLLNIIQAIEYLFKKNNGYNYPVFKSDFNNKRLIWHQLIDKSKLSENEKNELRKGLKSKLLKKIEQVKTVEMFMCSFNHVENELKNSINKSAFEKFSLMLKDCRDALVHVNHDTLAEVYNTHEVYKLFQIVQILFFALVGKELGMSSENIDRGLNNLDFILWDL